MVRNRLATGLLLVAGAACMAPLARAQPVALHGVAAERVAAIAAAMQALSPDIRGPGIAARPVGLNDADVVAQARALSDKAGHDGLHDDYFRFRVAIDKVRQMHADALDIPPGTYRIYPPADAPRHIGTIDLADLSHVVIDGHGANLLFYTYGKALSPLAAIHPRAAIRVIHSDHLVLKNLVIDWDEPLAVPVTVHGSGGPGSPQSLVVDAAFPIDPAAPIPLSVVEPYDMARRAWPASRDQTPAEFAAWHWSRSAEGSAPYTCDSPSSGKPVSDCFRYLGGQAYAFGPNEHLRPVSPNPGNYLALARDNNFSAVIVEGDASFIDIEGVTIYTSPGNAMAVITGGTAVRIADCQVARKPDARLRPGEPARFISTISDAMDVISSRGDVVIEGNDIGFQGDDGLNVRAALNRARALNADTLNAEAATAPHYYRVGERVDIYDTGARNRIAGDVPVTAVTPVPGEGLFAVTLGPRHPPLVAGAAYYLRARDWDSSHVIVRNNAYHDIAGHGVLVHGDDVAVIGNRFDRTTIGAISVLYDNQTGAPEGPPGHNIVIANNTITDTNRQWFDPATQSVAAPAAISVYAVARSPFVGNTGLLPGDPVARAVVIADNAIAHVPGAGILVSQADDVVIAGNRITDWGGHPFGLPLIDGHPIVIERTTGLRATGNTGDGGQPLSAR